jgi:lichenan operon transcriptional antiterminator
LVQEEDYEHTMLFLQQASSFAGQNLIHDFSLISSLAVHFSLLKKRIRYHSYLKNPMAEKIRIQYFQAYEAALSSISFLEQMLPEDEIALLAIYLQSALNSQAKKKAKKKILLVCGPSRLLEMQLRTYFEDAIESLDTISFSDLDTTDLSAYDCIFCSRPLTRKVDLPVYLVENVMDIERLKKLQKELSQKSAGLTDLSSPELFFVMDSFENPNEAIAYLCKQVQSQMESVPELYESILLRESLQSTEYNELCAFPHPANSLAMESFVCICVLKKPLQWNKQNIRIILLSHIGQYESRNLENFYAQFSALLLSKQKLYKLIQDPRYETFKKVCAL